MSRFNPEFYRQFRPFYPAATFAGLRERLLARGAVEPFSVADIGCGMGHSVVSLLRSGFVARAVGVDPDPEMLSAGRQIEDGVDFREGSGEDTGLETESLDALLVGSAFHWMDAARAAPEFARVLRPHGMVRVFEYQFPKCPALPELNEWIRREFNLRWKAPEQKPRGTLRQLTASLTSGGKFTAAGEGTPPMILALSPDELAGTIFSQSRVLHFENTLDAEERAEFHREVRAQVGSLMGERAHDFDFRLAWVEFLKA